MERRPVGLYLHVPFCAAKCHYCDFNSYAGIDHLIPAFAAALAREIADSPQPVPGDGASERPRLGIRTVNFGGGTPSLMPPAAMAGLLDVIAGAHEVLPGIEVSLEANPGTVERARLADFRAAGFNRVSFGVQTFEDRLLHRLGRVHSAADAAAALRDARRVGFDNVNLDFMYGLPGQDFATWRRTLDRAIQLGPDHLSLYSLQIEPGTRFHRWWEGGRLAVPDDDLVANMYEHARDALSAAGYVQYEISNWARDPSLACQHNLIYWRNEEYLGLGPGAHSGFDGRRYWNVLSPRRYVERVTGGGSPVAEAERIDEPTARAETAMLALRLAEGLDDARFRARFGVAPVDAFPSSIASSVADGLLERTATGYHLTRRGVPLGNEVFTRFVGEARAPLLSRS